MRPIWLGTALLISVGVLAVAPAARAQDGGDPSRAPVAGSSSGAPVSSTCDRTGTAADTSAYAYRRLDCRATGGRDVPPGDRVYQSLPGLQPPP